MGKYIRNIQNDLLRHSVGTIYFILTLLFNMIPLMVYQGYGRRIFYKEFWVNNWNIYWAFVLGAIKD